MLVADWRRSEKEKTNLPPLINGAYRLRASALAGSQCLCAVNKVLLFKHIQAWQFSFPRHVARVSLPGPELGAVQCGGEGERGRKKKGKEHRRVLVVMLGLCDQQLAVYCWCCCSAKVATHDGLSLRAAFLLTPLAASCYFRTPSKMRSKRQNKFEAAAARGRESRYCLTSGSHLRYGWLVQWRHFAVNRMFTSVRGLKHCLCITGGKRGGFSFTVVMAMLRSGAYFISAFIRLDSSHFRKNEQIR